MDLNSPKYEPNTDEAQSMQVAERQVKLLCLLRNHYLTHSVHNLRNYIFVLTTRIRGKKEGIIHNKITC